jgi:hypothetical protein
MKILKGRYQNGQVKLAEPAPEPGPVDVEVVFLDADDRRWDDILKDPAPRPNLSAAADEVFEDYRSGKTTPLDPDKL